MASAVCALGYGEQRRTIFAKWLDGRPLTP
jgi:hypothetical protein